MPTYQARRLFTKPDGTPIEVALGIPEPHPGGRGWRCAVVWSWGESPVLRTEQVAGGDAFQALQLALEAIYREAETNGYSLEGGPPGYHGFFESIMVDPLVYDTKRISKMVADEIDRQSEEIRARREAKQAEKGKTE